MSFTPELLRAELDEATARIPALEAAVINAQERLQKQKVKIELLRQLIAHYEPPDHLATEQVTFLPPIAMDALNEPAPWSVRTKETKAAAMERAIDSMLLIEGTVHRKDILAFLEDKKIMGGEKNPLGHLAAFMSDRREKYASDGRGNFKLRRNDELTKKTAAEIGATSESDDPKPDSGEDGKAEVSPAAAGPTTEADTQ